MMEWAEKEIEIACAREKAACENDPDSFDWKYGCACYESALKAFKCLMEDEHSGFSIGITKNILVRLIEGKPLTPIEDVPGVWNEVAHRTADDADPVESEYQCSRMSSLFKTVYIDGSVTYRDINRVRVTYVNNPGVYWMNGNATNIIDEMCPIQMPYMPDKGTFTVYAEDFLVDPTNGDYDTVGYLYARNPVGEKIEIGRYFKDDPESMRLIEIDYQEYCERKLAAHDLKTTGDSTNS
jgi:hypothetical protein